jgi:hypothetical protein
MNSPSDVIERDMEVEEFPSPTFTMNATFPTEDYVADTVATHELSDSDMEDDEIASPTPSSDFVISNKEALALSTAKNRMKRKAEASRTMRYPNSLERAKTAKPVITKKATSMKMRDASVAPAPKI